MRRNYLCVVVVFCLVSLGGAWLSAQSLNGIGTASAPAASWAKTTDAETNAPAATEAKPVSESSKQGSVATAPAPAPAAAPAAKTASADDSAVTMTESDFVINGVPYAEVLYLEGNVWIRHSTDTTFHQLTEDEPIPAQSVIYTGFNGTLDFATGPGMAVRMVPGTVLKVDMLPQPTAAPEASQVGVKRGTIFSALGREDSAPIDFQVRTLQGVASARGTMFSTSVTDGQAQVDMLHGTVNFETPDHQTSQITAGQSQQISGKTGGKFQFGQHQALNPANSETFFNHAGGLLEHASGYGAVRRGLGADVARTLQERGYKLPAATQARFQKAGTTRYTHRPGFNRTTNGKPAGAATGNHPESHSSTTTRENHPATPSTTSTTAAEKAKAEREREQEQRRRNAGGLDDRGDRNRDSGQ